MEILSSTPEQVDIRLVFERPFKADNKVAFELTPAEGDGTEVAWRMTGANSGFAALFAKVFPMDRVLGKYFEKASRG